MTITKREQAYIKEWLWDWITDYFADHSTNQPLLRKMSSSTQCLGWMVLNYGACPHDIGEYALDDLLPLFREAAQRAAEDFDLWAYGELPDWLV